MSLFPEDAATKTERPSRRLTPAAGVASAVLVAGVLAFLFVATTIPGCWSPEPIVIREENDEETANRCATLLANGVEMCDPTKLGLETEPEQAARVLTNWLSRPDCRASSPASKISPADAALLTRLLGEAAAKQVTSERFTQRDASYIRDSLLHAGKQKQLLNTVSGDLESVQTVFAYATRSITAFSAELTLPLPLHTVQMFGQGTPQDRALLFASLLRQMKFDAVILRPAAGSTASDSWWVGVLLDSGVYLYDMQIGLPVPVGNDSSAGSLLFQAQTEAELLPQPATWRQVVEHPEWLSAYREQAGLPALKIDAGALALPRVELISPAPSRRTAMERVERSLIRDTAVLLSDPLHSTFAGPGLYERVVTAGRGLWTPEAITIWDYPESRLNAYETLPEEATNAMQARWSVFMAPAEAVRDKATGELQDIIPTRQLWETRISQLAGRVDRAISSYLSIRSQQSLPDDPNIPQVMRLVNVQAADQAFYWISQSQFDERQYETGTQTSVEYFSRGGERGLEAAPLVVLGLAIQGQTDAAVQVVSQLPAQTPDRPRLLWLARRWNPGAFAAATPESPNTGTLSTSPSPSDTVEPVVAPRPDSTGSAVVPTQGSQPLTAPKP